MNTPPASPIDLALERTASDYDRTPYESHPFPLTRPAHLAAIAHLFSLAAPAVATARVLEIGCVRRPGRAGPPARRRKGRVLGCRPDCRRERA